MKKILALVLAAVLMLTFVSCTEKVKVLSYEEYVAAELNTEVVIEAYVQANQSWWMNDEGQGLITVYAQDKDGAYFMYEMACTEEESKTLTPGTKIRVTGYKAEWSGEVEIVDATFEVVKGDSFIAEAKDLTDKLGTEELINYQNQLALFKGMTVESIGFKDSEWDKDIYLTVSYGGNNYDFCVENYLCGPDTDVYKTVAALEVGTVIDVEGFVYWYNGVNTHITGVTVAK